VIKGLSFIEMNERERKREKNVSNQIEKHVWNYEEKIKV
jgi:hypothetical protein